MLYSREFHAAQKSAEKPTLVFLHGLLGDGSDWQCVIDNLTDYHCIAVDLPCHGQSLNFSPDNFNHAVALIRDAVLNVVNRNDSIVFVGYSLGARLAMVGLATKVFQDLKIIGYFIEGGNFGLTDEKQKRLRLKNDTHWANRFRHEVIEQVLSDWYQQAVFSSLNREQRDELMLKRAHNQGNAIADMLISTSLAKQPYLLNEIRCSGVPIHYICGGKDNKFLEIANTSGLFFTSIKNAGHNVHKEQPVQYAQLIREQLLSTYLNR